MTELKYELKKRGMPLSGAKPLLIDRLRPLLEEIIAAGRQQFQQPYKQISIPPGGLIILKPSPNSQLLTRPEPNSEAAAAGGRETPMHEGTPELGGEDVPMTPGGPPTTPNSGPATPFSPVNMMSPAAAVGPRPESSLEDILRESSPQQQQQQMNTTTNSMDLEFNLNLMEADTGASLTPAPPPPSPRSI